MERIKILSDVETGHGTRQGRVLIRLDTPASLVVPNPSAVSADPAATADETAALQAGTITEQISEVEIPDSWTTPTIEAYGQQMLAQLQAQLNATAPATSLKGMDYDDSAGWQNVPS